jgi:hypothetical protein
VSAEEPTPREAAQAHEDAEAERLLAGMVAHAEDPNAYLRERLAGKRVIPRPDPDNPDTRPGSDAG